MNKLITWSYILGRFLFYHALSNLPLTKKWLIDPYLIFFLCLLKDRDIDDGLTELRSGSSPDEGIGTELDAKGTWRQVDKSDRKKNSRKWKEFQYFMACIGVFAWDLYNCITTYWLTDFFFFSFSPLLFVYDWAGLGVITEEQEEEALGVVEAPEENCYSNIMMIQPRKKKSRNKSTTKKTHRDAPPTPVADETAVLKALNSKPGTILFSSSLSVFYDRSLSTARTRSFFWKSSHALFTDGWRWRDTVLLTIMAVGQPWILFTFFFLLPFIVDRCFVLYCLPGIEYSCRLKSFKRFGQSFCSEGRLTILLVITLTMTFTFSSCCLTKVVHYVDFSNSWWTCCPGGTNAKGPMHRSLSRDAATEEQSQNRKGKQTKQLIIGNIFRTEREKKTKVLTSVQLPFLFLF